MTTNTTLRNSGIYNIFGFYIAFNPWGNCFAPALIINRNKNAVKKAARATLTIRTKNCMETTFYWRGGLRFDWNSGHLARRFGKFIDTDFGGIYQWRNHIYI